MKDFDEQKPVSRCNVTRQEVPGPTRTAPALRGEGQEHGTGFAPTCRTRREIDADYPRLATFFDQHGFRQRFQPNSTILLHDEPADAIYRVVSGTVRCCTIDPDGVRQIFSFPREGEYVGLSDVEQWHFTAEAVDFVILKAVSKTTIEQALAVDIALRRDYRHYVTALIRQRERQLLFVTHTRATERLFQFLSAFASSRNTTGHISLPMSRLDIADHLGLSVETVSRSFTDLKQHGYIDLANSGKFKISKDRNGFENGPAIGCRKPAATGLLAAPVQGVANAPESGHRMAATAN